MVHPHDIGSDSEPWTIRIKCIAREFVSKGHEVKLAYFPLSSKVAKRYHLDGYEVISLNRNPSPLVFIKNTLLLSKLIVWADIVHFQKCLHYASVPVVAAAYLRGKPIHYDWDDWEEKIWYESCGRNIYSYFVGFSFKVLERFLPRLVDTVSVASNQLEKLALSFGVGKERIFSAPVGADLNEFSSNINGREVKERYGISGPLVLYVGQLHGGQYIDLFVKAANIILHRRPDVRFMIVGEGFLQSFLKRLTQDLGIEDKIIFTGAVPHSEIPKYIGASNVCVACFRDTEVSRSKSPLKIVEYLAMAKPIVASNVGEVRKMVGGVGFLIEPGSTEELAKGVLRIISDGRLRQAMRISGRRRVETKYNWKVTAENLLRAYQKGWSLCNKREFKRRDEL